MNLFDFRALHEGCNGNPFLFYFQNKKDWE
jgi:hypothetical protein